MMISLKVYYGLKKNSNNKSASKKMTSPRLGSYVWRRNSLALNCLNQKTSA